MSKYTTEVRFICETANGLTESKGGKSVEEIIEGALPSIFDFDFPIFDEAYRKNLEKKILRHFYTREIGEETVGLWKLRLNTKLNEIMPYYNQLYKSELLEFNPLYTRNIERTGTRNGSTTDNTYNNLRTDSNSTNWNLYSDTPQGGLSGVDSNTYLTNATKNTNSSHVENGGSINGDGTSTEDYLERIVGFDGGNASKLLLDYRKTFLNIDMRIIEDLDVLFMQLW